MEHYATSLQPLLLLQLLILILPLLTFSSRLTFDDNPSKNGFRVNLTHIDAGLKNLTKLQLIQRAIINWVKPRLEKLSAITKNGQIDDIRAPVYVGDGEFLMNLSIGTPAVLLVAIMDTGSDLIWTQCKPCTYCFEQATPVFNPKLSSSFLDVTCSSNLCKALRNSRCGNGCREYLNVYGDGSSSQGFLSRESLTFEEQVFVPRIGFGCGENNQVIGMKNVAGIAGLGRGTLSLVSQLGSRKYSYCSTSIGDNKSSSLLFGSLVDLTVSNGAVKSTPLIRSPILPSLYYSSLEGITVGQTLLPIPKSLFQIGSDGGGGLMIDSGTTAFVAQTKLQVSYSYTTEFDLCFDLPSKNVEEIKFPRLVFHFKGLDLELRAENYMIPDTKLGLACLTMRPKGRLSVFGNCQQRNICRFFG
ncbi:hypothetical protein ACJW30_12G123400 [Castanea mollissima]